VPRCARPGRHPLARCNHVRFDSQGFVFGCFSLCNCLVCLKPLANPSWPRLMSLPSHARSSELNFPQYVSPDASIREASAAADTVCKQPCDFYRLLCTSLTTRSPCRPCKLSISIAIRVKMCIACCVSTAIPSPIFQRSNNDVMNLTPPVPSHRKSFTNTAS
jgi:hypothetical protein